MTGNNGIEFLASNVTKVWVGNKTVLFSYSAPSPCGYAAMMTSSGTRSRRG